MQKQQENEKTIVVVVVCVFWFRPAFLETILGCVLLFWVSVGLFLVQKWRPPTPPVPFLFLGFLLVSAGLLDRNWHQPAFPVPFLSCLGVFWFLPGLGRFSPGLGGVAGAVSEPLGKYGTKYESRPESPRKTPKMSPCRRCVCMLYTYGAIWV